MRDSYAASTSYFLLLLLSISIPSVLLSVFASVVLTTLECPAAVSYPVKATLDNAKLFSQCALESASVRIDVHSLFDVFNLSERDFLLFCRSSECVKPVKTLLHSIPTDCLITYHGSTRNLSEEVSTLLHECVEVVGAADQTDEDYVYRYFLD